MRPETRKLIWDAREAASQVREFLAGKSFEVYLREPMLRSAVERQLEIIGEALQQLSKRDVETAASVPELPKIVGLRNVLIHGYTSIDHQLVWSIVESKLGPLTAVLDELLRRSDATS